MLTVISAIEASASTGIPFIDIQHRTIISQLQSLAVRIENGYAGMMLKENAKEILLKIREHSLCEECWMIRAMYFDYESHKSAHKTLLKFLESAELSPEKDGIEASVENIEKMLSAVAEHQAKSDSLLFTHSGKYPELNDMSDLYMNPVRRFRFIDTP